MSRYLHGLHDAGGEENMRGHPGWIVHTVALLSEREHDYTRWQSQGFHNIVRLNWGYGSDGTIPTSDKYHEYAQACANFVMHSPGIEWVIIGNEPNHQQEWPHGQEITAMQYAKCFDLAYTAIRDTGTAVQIMTAGIAPWNQQAGDWLTYYRVILRNISDCDGFALHAYTHGTNPDLVFSDQKVEGWFWNFRTYQDQIACIEDVHRFPKTLPAFITESDQDEPWRDVNSGWIRNALAEINAWNGAQHTRKVHSLCFYRWQEVPGDQWGMERKQGVIDDFKQGAAFGYSLPSLPVPPTPEPGPEPTPPNPTPTPEPEYPREIDLRLIARGVFFNFVKPTPGQQYWRITKAQWLEDAANQVGPDHHILGQLMKEHVETAGVPLLVNWPSGSTHITSKSDDPNASYNYDYGMSASLNEFGIKVDDGIPSDHAGGIGMGYGGNPAEHSSTWITFELVTATSEPITPPILPPPHGEIETGMVTALAGLNLRAEPNTTSDVLGTLTYGSTVISDEEHEGWLRFVSGWVSAEYVGESIPVPPLLTPPPFVPGLLAHPLPGSTITQHFYQNPRDYLQFFMPGHNGTDFGGALHGESIYSIADGVVYRSEFDIAYGNFIMVAHDALKCYSLYAHCSDVVALIGQTVKMGEPIAFVGSTGNSTGDHLHLEIRLMNPDGTYRDGTPMPKGRVDAETFFAMHGSTL